MTGANFFHVFVVHTPLHAVEGGAFTTKAAQGVVARPTFPTRTFPLKGRIGAPASAPSFGWSQTVSHNNVTRDYHILPLQLLSSWIARRRIVLATKASRRPFMRFDTKYLAPRHASQDTRDKTFSFL